MQNCDNVSGERLRSVRCRADACKLKAALDQTGDAAMKDVTHSADSLRNDGVRGDALRLNDVAEWLANYDIVVSCTASPLPIIGLGLVERALKTRRHRPMVMVDLAIPRDIEKEVGELDDVFLYTIDDLGQIVESGLESRQAAVIEAEAIIDERVQVFLHWLASRETVPTIRALRDATERMRRHELEHALKLLARGDAPDKVLDALSHGLTNKFLHAPTQALNQAESDERADIVALISRLYHLSSTD